ncbi:MAG: Na+/H+ antiporter subunit E [Haliea sp.]|nr:MAG: Na+/H+ antiporter subunit E [Haliea sp.]
MKHILPAPPLSLALFVLWLLLNQSISAGHLLIAALVAVAMPLLSAPLRPQRSHVLRPLVLLRLVMTVGADVVLSCMQVAAGVLRWRTPPRSAFVTVALDLRDPHGLAALAVINTVVPGTVWCELAPDRSAVLLHVFNVGDEAAFIAHYKQRYESPLMEIFQ